MYMYIWIDLQKFCVCARAKCLHQCLAHAMLLSYHTLPHSVLKSDWVSFGPAVHHDFSVSLYLLPSWPVIASYPPALMTQVRSPPLGCLGSPSLHLVVCNFPQPINGSSRTPCNSFLIFCHQWRWAPWGQGLCFIALYPASSTVSWLQQCSRNICWTNANNQNDL